MQNSGSFGGYFDVAQVVLYLFWIFFAGLIYYLLRENKREGYPLDSDRTERSGGRVQVIGFPPMPRPKTFKLANGATKSVPNAERDQRPIAAAPVAGFPGAPLEPTGNPMLDGVGPAAYAQRSDMPDMTYDGYPKIVPLRVATDYTLDPEDPDPRGKPVIGADGERGGIVRDAWVDRAECVLRYLEVETGAGESMRRVLLPVTFSRITHTAVRVNAILAAQFAQVPALRRDDSISLLEEDRVCAYYGGGILYATPARRESML